MGGHRTQNLPLHQSRPSNSMVSHFSDGVLVNTAYHTSRPIIRLGFSRALVILLVAFMAASCGDDSGPPENQPPIAEFVAPACTEGLACTFTDSSTDPDGDETIASWAWDFGDAGTSDLQNPSHIFSPGGPHDVTLTVTDANTASNSVTHTVTINRDPSTEFGWQCNALECIFTDTSTDPDGDETIASWAWDFGDGGTSDLQNPSHTFSSSGTYEVVLLIADNAGGTNGLLRQVAVSTPP